MRVCELDEGRLGGCAQLVVVFSGDPVESRSDRSAG